MYGAQQSTAAGAALAYTGAETGAWALAAVGLILAGLALVSLVRKSGKDRP